MAARLLYRTLISRLREQLRCNDYRASWPKQPGLRGLAAATGMIVDGDDLLLEWEDLLQRQDTQQQASLSELLRPMFDSAEASNPLRTALEEYPGLSAKLLLLGGADPIDRGFAALRLSSQYSQAHAELQEVVERHSVAEPPPRKLRPAGLHFALGDVLQHRFFGRCVVVGWDGTCQQAEAWVRTNRIRENLTFGTDQPFYSVLLEDNEVPRYCSQENLALLAEARGAFDHPHAAYYFQRPRDGDGQFVPAEPLAFVYPGDRAAALGERNHRDLDAARDGELGATRS